MYHKMQDDESAIMDALDINPEWKPSEWLNAFYEILSDMCELEERTLEYGTTLDWWVFETNFGSEDGWAAPMIMVYGENINLPDAGALYDYLMKYEVKE